MSKIINIDGSRYALPEGMTTKDIQALAGILVTLTKVDCYYEYPNYDSIWYAGEGVQVGIGESQLLTKDQAKAKSDESKAREEARKAAQPVADQAAA